MSATMKSFFRQSFCFAELVLRPMSHICGNWDLLWDFENDCYKTEVDCFAGLVNALIEELETTRPPPKYHDSEDRLAEYVVKTFKWPIRKVGNRWIGADYDSILEYGGHDDIDQKELVLAAAGRIQAARKRKQLHFDDMEESHLRMLAAVIIVILYHRAHLVEDESSVTDSDNPAE
jgi:hypothetical protein